MGRRQHGEGRARPCRRVDRIERALGGLLSVLSVLASLVIAASLFGSYTSGLDGAAREQAERTAVEATVLVAAPDPAPGAGRSSTVPVRVEVTWTARDGRVHSGTVRAPGRPSVGEVVSIWVDRAGAAVPAPTTAGSVLGGVLCTAVVLIALLVTAVLAAHRALRALFVRVGAAAWAREWAQVEPRWSGRTSTG